MKATLIQCTNAKRDSAAPARDLYDPSTLFCKMRGYAQARGEPWFIVSAKHGLVDPDTVVEPYDDRGLSDETAMGVVADLERGGVDSVQIIGGKEYVEPLSELLREHGIEYEVLCDGLRIGERMSRLGELRKQEEYESIC